LRLADLPNYGLPGGIPSELSKLTCLDVSNRHGFHAAKQFQHLNSLTALQELKIESFEGLEELP
jgi:hypothetical protein